MLFVSLGIALDLWAEQLVGAVRGCGIGYRLLVPTVLGVVSHRPPARLVAGDRVPVSGGLEVVGGRPVVADLVSLEELSVPDHAAGAVQLDRGDSLAFEDPLGAFDALVPDQPVRLVVSLEKADYLVHCLSPELLVFAWGCVHCGFLDSGSASGGYWVVGGSLLGDCSLLRRAVDVGPGLQQG